MTFNLFKLSTFYIPLSRYFAKPSPKPFPLFNLHHWEIGKPSANPFLSIVIDHNATRSHTLFVLCSVKASFTCTTLFSPENKRFCFYILHHYPIPSIFTSVAVKKIASYSTFRKISQRRLSCCMFFILLPT